MESRKTVWGVFAAAAVGVMLAACGGGMSSPTAPSSTGSSTSAGSVTSGATITITAAGQVSPSSVSIAVGQAVTVVNNDSRPHEIASDPHPTHTNCPSINAVGSIGAGQTKTTNAFTSAQTCGYHDHNDPGNASLQGQIIIR
jgi:plastocyanin